MEHIENPKMARPQKGRFEIRKIIAYGVLLLAAYVLYQNMFPSFPAGSPLIGKPVPVFETTNIETGEILNLAEHTGKKVILINFWATWCPSCREEIPLLNELAKTLDPSKFLLVAVSEDDHPNSEKLKQALMRFKQKLPFAFGAFKDDGGRIADLFGTFQLPESYLVDQNGIVQRKFAGPVSQWDIQHIAGMVNQAQGEQSHE